MTMQDLSGSETPYSGVLSRGMNDIQALSESLGYLWTQLGASVVDFEGFDRVISSGNISKALTDFPNYCWDHDRIYWSESRAAREFNGREDPPHELLGFRDKHSTEKEFRWRNLIIPKEIPWVCGHQIQGQIVYPAAAYISMAVEALRIMTKEKVVRLIEVHDLDIGRAIIFDSEKTGVETLCTLTAVDGQINTVSAEFMIYACLNRQKGHLQLMASCRVHAFLGEPSPDILPPIGKSYSNMVSIDLDRFYANLDQLGFGYKDAFKQMSSLNRKLGSASGTIYRPVDNSDASKLLVHPPTLDIAFHGVMATWFFPMDDRLWTIFLPRSIKRITINPALCHRGTERDMTQPWRSTMSHDKPGEIVGDVDVYDDQNRAVLQIEELRLVALKGTAVADDRKFYYEELWSPATPDGGSIVGVEATSFEASEAIACERVVAFFSRTLIAELPVENWNRFGSHFARLAKGMAKISSVASIHSHSIERREWMQDTRETVSAFVEK